MKAFSTRLSIQDRLKVPQPPDIRHEGFYHLTPGIILSSTVFTDGVGGIVSTFLIDRQTCALTWKTQQTDKPLRSAQLTAGCFQRFALLLLIVFI